MAFKVPYQSYPALPQSQGGLFIARNFSEVQAIIDGLRTDVNNATAKLSGGTNGYLGPASDPVVQWGTHVVTPDGNGDFTFTYPLPFTAVPSVVLFMNNERGQGTFYCGEFQGSRTATTCRIRAESHTGPFTPISRYGWFVGR
jgi:hypothetical protein